MAANPPIITGTFLQESNAVNTWAGWRWNRELSDMDQVGIKTVILQWALDEDDQKTLYPGPPVPNIPGTSTPYIIGPDYTDPLLYYGAQHNDQIWLGLANFGAWQAHATDSTWLTQQLALQEQVADELYALYANNPAWKGWYISFEIDATLLSNPAATTPMTNYFTALINYLHTHDGNKPVMVSPTYSIYGVVLDPTNFAAKLLPVVAGVDVIALQDGGSTQTPATIGSYLAALSAAAPSATQIWQNCDMFSATGGGPIDPARLQANIAAGAPYVSQIIGFSFTSQMGPSDTPDPTAYRIYLAYYSQYVKPGAGPSLPAKPVYAYLLADTMTGKVLAQLPFIGVSFDTRLNENGSLQASLPLFDPHIQSLNWAAATTPVRNSVYVLRNDQAVWGGIIWTRVYDSQKQRMDIQAGTFETYYRHVPFGPGGKSWTNVDQFQIVRDILAAINASGYCLPLPVSTNTSGIFRTFQILGYDYKWVSDIISSLQQLPNGFDFAADVYYNPTIGPYKQLNLAYPRRGLTAVNTPWVFEYPGNIMWYHWPEDGSSYCNAIVETGAGSGPNMPVGTAGNPGDLAAGWPIMFQEVSRKDIQQADWLTLYANGDLAVFGSPAVKAELHVRADMDPVLGSSYLVGDDIRVKIFDPWYPAGLDTFLRIIALKVTVSDDGFEDVQITAAPPTV